MPNESINHDDTLKELPISKGAVVESPFCGSLRSKKFFMLDAIATSSEQYIDASNHCWCRETQQVIGPDGGSVHPERCGPNRRCYTSALDGV